MDLRRALVVGSTGSTGSAVVKALEKDHEVVGIARSGATYNVDLMYERPPEIDLAPDVIVHVMGGTWNTKSPLSDQAAWMKEWSFNLGIQIDINRMFIPEMIKKGFGRIVHFSSNGVKLAIGHPPYTAAKAAVEGYVRTMGKVFGPKGVVITAVRPGPIKSKGFIYKQDEKWTKGFMDSYVPMGRWGKPDELAGVVAFLCSDQASYMAGAIVDVDGGMR